MKKIIYFIFSLTLTFVLIGCSAEESSSASDEPNTVQREESEAKVSETAPESTTETQGNQILIAYFFFS